MKVSYLSDLHLEFRNYPNWDHETGGDVLILAGDIVTAYAVQGHRTDKDGRSIQKYLSGPFKKFIDKFEHVFYVAGNHEYYHSVFSETESILRKEFDNLGLGKISIFNNNCQLVDGVLFIGCPLWTSLKNGSPLVMNIAQQGMNDYTYIYSDWLSKQAITPEDTLNEHTKSVAYIKDVLKWHKDKKTVVFTHMAPTFRSTYQSGELDYAYASDLSELILDNPQIEYWISGHTHQHDSYLIGDKTIAVSNPRGYSGERCFANFTGTRSFEI